MKPFDDGCAANDEFQSVLGSTTQGELIWDLLRQRVRTPEQPSDYLVRPGLSARLQGALAPGAILHLEAPSGFGKTLALSAALAESSGHPNLQWISLTSQDNDAVRLLALLTIALRAPGQQDVPAGRQRVGGMADALSLLLGETPQQTQAAPVTLVLDNVDQVVSPSAVALLEQLLAELPPWLSLALISRKALPFETHGLELGGRFTRIAGDSLELSRSETLAFFEPAIADGKLTTVAVEHLYSLTEGWLTPLALYRRELATASNERFPIQETLNVERFLRDSVFGRLTPAQQRSLAMMAELDSISDDLFAAMADDVCDRQFRPSRVVASGLPMRSVPGRGRWYRLNPLLREWLLVPGLDDREARAMVASRWFEKRDEFPEALRYALISNDVEEALRIAAEGSEALLVGQDTASLLRLQRSLPAGLFQRSPRLRIVYGWVHAIGGQFRAARALLDGLPEEDRLAMKGRIHALMAVILRGEGSVEAAIEEADLALSCGELSTQAQLVSQLIRASAMCARGRFSEARSANRIAARLAREAGDPGSEILAVYAHARIELGKGSLRHSEQLLRTALDTAMNVSNRPARVGEIRLQLNLALVLWHQGREAEADRLLVTCGRYAEQSRDLGLLLIMALRVLICRSQGRLDDAFAWIGQAERTMQSWQVDDTVYVPVLEALKANCWLALDQPDSAAMALRRLEPYRRRRCAPELIPVMPGLLDCLQVRLDLRLGHDKAAAKLLEAIRQEPFIIAGQAGEGQKGESQEGESQEGKRAPADVVLPFGLALQVRLLQVVLDYRSGRIADARNGLLTAIEEAAPEHYISPFLELREELVEPLQKVLAAPQAEAHGAFTGALRHAFGLPEASQEPVVQLAEPISDREQAVLELIAQGLSNQDIADRLHISLHTVKTHARRINAKLEVRSRTQAIVRARELGLL